MHKNVFAKSDNYVRSEDVKWLKLFSKHVSAFPSVFTGVPQEAQGCSEEADVLPEELRIVGNEVFVFQHSLP